MKKKKNSNVINLIKDSKMNVAIIIFAAILLYVAISVVISMKKEPVATYKVGDSDISDNISCTGIAIRNEIVVKASRSGYITYFTRNNDKVRKGSAVCTIDDTGSIIRSSESTEDEGINITKNDYPNIRNHIYL